ncbi:hypothetical protein BESB_046290 [Besnoitia besnoiti]|uniref:Uncharacterized protein n=1 Tax=Besnoitia besnoiti TaxID=94643 RepID=A0A2A9MLD0_BESBE|nr:hypothetical protein BESB_046290 [Besnoitia besnoiti]PFH36437.1 hypothetical protein BESB_046290 [Besnoitia besnoiti]
MTAAARSRAGLRDPSPVTTAEQLPPASLRVHSTLRSRRCRGSSAVEFQGEVSGELVLPADSPEHLLARLREQEDYVLALQHQNEQLHDDLADAQEAAAAADCARIPPSVGEDLEAQALRGQVEQLLQQQTQRQWEAEATSQMLVEAKEARAAADQQLREAEKAQRDLQMRLAEAENTLERLLEQAHDSERTEQKLREALETALQQRRAAERQLEELKNARECADATTEQNCEEDGSARQASQEAGYPQDAVRALKEGLQTAHAGETGTEARLGQLEGEIARLEAKLAAAVREKEHALEAVEQHRYLLEKQRKLCQVLRHQLAKKALDLSKSEHRQRRRLWKAAEEQKAMAARLQQSDARHERNLSAYRQRLEQLERRLMVSEETLQRQTESLAAAQLADAQQRCTREAERYDRQMSRERHALQCEEMRQRLGSLEKQWQQEEEHMQQLDLQHADALLSRQELSERHLRREEELEAHLEAERASRLRSREVRSLMEEDLAELLRKQDSVRRQLEKLRRAEQIPQADRSRTADFAFYQFDTSAHAGDASTPPKEKRVASQDIVLHPLDPEDLAAASSEDAASSTLGNSVLERRDSKDVFIAKLLGLQISSAVERLGAAQCRERDLAAEIQRLEEFARSRTPAPPKSCADPSGALHLQQRGSAEGQKIVKQDLEASLLRLTRECSQRLEEETKRNDAANAVGCSEAERLLLRKQQRALQQLELELRARAEAAEAAALQLEDMTRRVEDLEARHARETRALAEREEALYRARARLSATHAGEEEEWSQGRGKPRDQLQQKETEQTGTQHEGERERPMEDVEAEGKTQVAEIPAKVEAASCEDAHVLQLKHVVGQKVAEIANLRAALEEAREAITAMKAQQEECQAALRNQDEALRQQLAAQQAALQAEWEAQLRTRDEAARKELANARAAFDKQMQRLEEARELELQTQPKRLREAAEAADVAAEKEREQRFTERQVAAVVQMLRQESYERRTMRLEELEDALRDLSQQKARADSLAAARQRHAPQLLGEQAEGGENPQPQSDAPPQHIEALARELAHSRIQWLASRERWQLPHESDAAPEESLLAPLHSESAVLAWEVQQRSRLEAEAERGQDAHEAEVARLQGEHREILAQQHAAARDALSKRNLAEARALEAKIREDPANLQQLSEQCREAEAELADHQLRRSTLATEAARDLVQRIELDSALEALGAAEERARLVQRQRDALRSDLALLQDARDAAHCEFQQRQRAQEKTHAAQLEEILTIERIDAEHQSHAVTSGLIRCTESDAELHQLDKAERQAAYVRRDCQRIQQEADHIPAQLASAQANLQQQNEELASGQRQEAAQVVAREWVRQLEISGAVRRLEEASAPRGELAPRRDQLEAELRLAGEGAEHEQQRQQERALEGERLQHAAALETLQGDLAVGRRLLLQQLEQERVARVREQQAFENSTRLLLLRLDSAMRRLEPRTHAAADAEGRAAAALRDESERREEGALLRADLAERSERVHVLQLLVQKHDARLQLQAEIEAHQARAEAGLRRLEELRNAEAAQMDLDRQEVAEALQKYRSLLDETVEARLKQQERDSVEQLWQELEAQQDAAQREYEAAKRAALDAEAQKQHALEREAERRCCELRDRTTTQRLAFEPQLRDQQQTHALALERQLAKKQAELDTRHRQEIEAKLLLLQRTARPVRERRGVEAELQATEVAQKAAEVAQKAAHERETAAIEDEREARLQGEREAHRERLEIELREQESNFEEAKNAAIAAALDEHRAQWQAELEAALEAATRRLEQELQRQHAHDLEQGLVEAARAHNEELHLKLGEFSEALQCQEADFDAELARRLAQASACHSRALEAQRGELEARSAALLLERQLSCERRLQDHANLLHVAHAAELEAQRAELRAEEAQRMRELADAFAEEKTFQLDVQRLQLLEDQREKLDTQREALAVEHREEVARLRDEIERRDRDQLMQRQALEAAAEARLRERQRSFETRLQAQKELLTEVQEARLAEQRSELMARQAEALRALKDKFEKEESRRRDELQARLCQGERERLEAQMIERQREQEDKLQELRSRFEKEQSQQLQQQKALLLEEKRQELQAQRDLLLAENQQRLLAAAEEMEREKKAQLQIQAEMHAQRLQAEMELQAESQKNEITAAVAARTEELRREAEATLTAQKHKSDAENAAEFRRRMREERETLEREFAESRNLLEAQLAAQHEAELGEALLQQQREYEALQATARCQTDQQHAQQMQLELASLQARLEAEQRREADAAMEALACRLEAEFAEALETKEKELRAELESAAQTKQRAFEATLQRQREEHEEALRRAIAAQVTQRWIAHGAELARQREKETAELEDALNAELSLRQEEMNEQKRKELLAQEEQHQLHLQQLEAALEAWQNARLVDELRVEGVSEKRREMEEKLRMQREELQLELDAKLARKELELESKLQDELLMHRKRLEERMREKEAEAHQRLQRERDARRGLSERARTRQIELELQLQQLREREAAMRLDLEKQTQITAEGGKMQEEREASWIAQAAGTFHRRLAEASESRQMLTEETGSYASVAKATQEALRVCEELLKETQNQLEASKSQDTETQRALGRGIDRTNDLCEDLALALQQVQLAQEQLHAVQVRDEREMCDACEGLSHPREDVCVQTLPAEECRLQTSGCGLCARPSGAGTEDEGLRVVAADETAREDEELALCSLHSEMELLRARLAGLDAEEAKNREELEEARQEARAAKATAAAATAEAERLRRQLVAAGETGTRLRKQLEDAEMKLAAEEDQHATALQQVEELRLQHRALAAQRVTELESLEREALAKSEEADRLRGLAALTEKTRSEETAAAAEAAKAEGERRARELKDELQKKDEAWRRADAERAQALALAAELQRRLQQALETRETLDKDARALREQKQKAAEAAEEARQHAAELSRQMKEADDGRRLAEEKTRSLKQAVAELQRELDAKAALLRKSQELLKRREEEAPALRQEEGACEGVGCSEEECGVLASAEKAGSAEREPNDRRESFQGAETYGSAPEGVLTCEEKQVDAGTEAERRQLETHPSAHRAGSHIDEQPLRNDAETLESRHREMEREAQRMDEARLKLAQEAENVRQLQREHAVAREDLATAQKRLKSDEEELRSRQRDLERRETHCEELQAKLAAESAELSQLQEAQANARLHLEEERAQLEGEARSCLQQQRRRLEGATMLIEDSRATLVQEIQRHQERQTEYETARQRLAEGEKRLGEERQHLAVQQHRLAEKQQRFSDEQERAAADQQLLQQSQQEVKTHRQELEETKQAFKILRGTVEAEEAARRHREDAARHARETVDSSKRGIPQRRILELENARISTQPWQGERIHELLAGTELATAYPHRPRQAPSPSTTSQSQVTRPAPALGGMADASSRRPTEAVNSDFLSSGRLRCSAPVLVELRTLQELLRHKDLEIQSLAHSLIQQRGGAATRAASTPPPIPEKLPQSLRTLAAPAQPAEASEAASKPSEVERRSGERPVWRRPASDSRLPLEASFGGGSYTSTGAADASLFEGTIKESLPTELNGLGRLMGSGATYTATLPGTLGQTSGSNALGAVQPQGEEARGSRRERRQLQPYSVEPGDAPQLGGRTFSWQSRPLVLWEARGKPENTNESQEELEVGEQRAAASIAACGAGGGDSNGATRQEAVDVARAFWIAANRSAVGDAGYLSLWSQPLYLECSGVASGEPMYLCFVKKDSTESAARRWTLALEPPGSSSLPTLAAAREDGRNACSARFRLSSCDPPGRQGALEGRQWPRALSQSLSPQRMCQTLPRAALPPDSASSRSQQLPGAGASARAASDYADPEFALRLSPSPHEDGLVWLHFLESAAGCTVGNAPTQTPHSDAPAPTREAPRAGIANAPVRAVKMQHATTGLFLTLRSARPPRSPNGPSPTTEAGTFFETDVVALTADARRQGAFAGCADLVGASEGCSASGDSSETTHETENLFNAAHVRRALEAFSRTDRGTEQLRGLRGTPDAEEATVFVLMERDELAQRTVSEGEGW